MPLRRPHPRRRHRRRDLRRGRAGAGADLARHPDRQLRPGRDADGHDVHRLRACIQHGGSYWLGFAVALASGFVLGAVVERVLIRRVEDAPPLNAVIVTLGLSSLLSGARRDDLGRQRRAPTRRRSRIRGYTVGGAPLLFSPNDLFIVVAVGVVVVALCRAVPAHRARPADARRGVRAGGRPAARRARRRGCSPSAGRSPRWSARWPGVLVAPSVFVAPERMDVVLVFGFTAAVLGGLDSPVGAVVGGLVARAVALSYVGRLPRARRS